jgi:hypothetical protein
LTETTDDSAKMLIASAARSFLQLAFTAGTCLHIEKLIFVAPSSLESLTVLERLSEVGRLLYQLLYDIPSLESAVEPISLDTENLQHSSVQSLSMVTYVIVKFHRFPKEFETKDQVLSKVANFDKQMICMDPLNLNKIASLGYWYLDKNLGVIQNWIDELFVGLQHVGVLK